MTSTYYELNDVHNKIKDIPTDSIHLIYTSPPYGITRASWDKPLRWAELFPEMWRVLKPNGIIILHASMPFTYELLKYETPKYHYIWIKHISTGFLTAKYQPLRNTEEVFIYYKKRGTYNPQMEGDIIIKPRKHQIKNGEGYYNIAKDKVCEEAGHIGRFPKTALEYKTRYKSGGGITRSDELIEYFIKTYSNETDMVLDLTCCNKIVGDVVIKLNRNYIGIDIREIK
jgi:site-specific DNA-methyltransferase (adenine-specific)